MTFFGEGTASTGEFHVGMNFAGVWKAPCILFCRSNRPIAARSFVAKAAGYGMPGVRVDGNDVLAVWQVATEAIERARAGGGPTLIEAITRGDHDPLPRMAGLLRTRGLWTEAWEQERSEGHQQAITDALAAADRKPAPPVDSLFDDVYEQLPWHLREQRAYLASQPRATNPHPHGGD
jgi:TPP-dependent pyruvate/acetoin dehydrogenase alpha subunit